MYIYTTIIVFIGIFLFWIIITYNKLVRMIEVVNNNEKQIDIQLDRRYKIYESLINVVQKYMDYEATTLKKIVELRSQAEIAKTNGNELERIKQEEAISKIGFNFNAVFEQYPNLKTNESILKLQEEITSTENKLAFAKQCYNDSVEQYTATKNFLFESVLISLFSTKLFRQFNYWGFSSTEKEDKEKYKIDFINNK